MLKIRWQQGSHGLCALPSPRHPDGRTVFTLFKDEYHIYVKQFYADFIRSTSKDVKKTITNEQINALIDEANEKGIAKITI